MIFRGTKNGFRAKDFHEKCDNKGPTITIVQDVKGYIFGGYTSMNW